MDRGDSQEIFLNGFLEAEGFPGAVSTRNPTHRVL